MVVSPTQIETFDERTTWGCNLKWYLSYVSKLKYPPDPALAMGSAVHETIEAFLKSGEPGVLHKIARPGLKMLQDIRPRIVLIEHKIEPGELTMGGAQVIGRLDAMAMGEVIDWKTTSSIAKWAKTPGQLTTSVQMTVYAQWAKQNTDLMLDEGAIFTLGYFQTKGEGSLPVSVQLTGNRFRQNTEDIVDTIGRMVKVSGLKAEEVTPDASKCFVGFGCPHRAVCPRFSNPERSSSVASLFSSFGISTPPPAQPPAQAVVEAKAEPPAVAAVLPPDAPKSDPALAALPPKGVELPAAVLLPIPPIPGVTEPKRPGRPPGAKNKPKEEGRVALSAPVAPKAAEIAQKAEAPVREVAPVKVTSITIRHGARLSLGQKTFSSIDVEVEMTAETHGDPDTARETLSVFVKSGLLKELQVYNMVVPKVEGGS